MDVCNFDALSKVELLKLCKQKELKVGKGATKLNLQVALKAFEKEERGRPTSEGYEVDENEEDDAHKESEDGDVPAQDPELLHSIPADY
ncbi:hypothetical protein NDU88_002523 [Pleurodeles waltl]|uniref:Uncharacterized protein n=1 Tax=Pleurodeles waltl TaxID=8319 RepID=A0AAV7MQU3_PLEWA|nr:hypothetical protein NDU88_002523 [Pleurodeles waltl]